jgi:predicted polyphosphate/ATP-dependent NAD kinase
MRRIGFLINPIAGMGGRVGLKGTDGVVAEAVRRGAEPVANLRAREGLNEFKRLLDHSPYLPTIQWLTASGKMGESALRSAGFTAVAVVHTARSEPSAHDTRMAVASNHHEFAQTHGSPYHAHLTCPSSPPSGVT